MAGALLLNGSLNEACFGFSNPKTKVAVDAHLWVYASRYPPDWDCTPILDEAFSDIKYAGYDRIELMESILKHEDAVNRINDLIHKYNLPVTGTSYYGDMWDKNQQQHLLEDIEFVIERLHSTGGKMIGLTVGDAERTKTEDELDTQADTLKKIMVICNKNEVIPNLHNHTFEVTNGLHDLKGTLKRIPNITLGSIGDKGRSVISDLQQADASNITSAFIGGIVFNAANILFSAALAVAGMAVAFHVGIGIHLSTINYDKIFIGYFLLTNTVTCACTKYENQECDL